MELVLVDRENPSKDATLIGQLVSVSRTLILGKDDKPLYTKVEIVFAEAIEKPA